MSTTNKEYTFEEFVGQFNQLSPENRLEILTLLFELAGEEL